MTRYATTKQLAYMGSLATKAPATFDALLTQMGVDQADKLTPKQASTVIDALKHAAPRPITPRQIDFLMSLIAEVPEAFRELAADMDGIVTISAVEDGKITAQQATFLIDALKARRADVRVLEEAEAIIDPLTPGVYMRAGIPVKVYPSRETGQLLAKKLTDDGWVYLGRAARFVKAADRMSVEEAKQYGADFGICACCGRELTDEKSIMLGIGPVCFRKYF